jgi:FKBP-type peptidyl-prolyl cis-trans isomerase FkpA
MNQVLENNLTNSNVTVAYKGYFTDGKVFDQSSEAGISFGLQVIKRMDRGNSLFQRRRTVFC